ncbi:hypothetical protein CANTEDRAFT_92202 [Yamadazyma tenuis ATCC 10573]|uniref:Transcription factor IIIC 90kDa subunit N-terminal domain-containing protein n=1 Tax=Candida tenuis (strain ATCC 10573 / BCRC 21748 / CBS 615 / JCM 9827 / NBRC 10315 / NRRL Y-1498 / VKM Y-70) TaxID=590646 RepID=G3AYJ0_CANTC|nr:uncharacterized protein CANTEDRAFT_92202 [Yamadazyma tenuis ATCC 10573]EGV65863.1 hypothetical protein CANTEDRAFT_92202 [Yamadazyma tenuis ATCC 10573]
MILTQNISRSLVAHSACDIVQWSGNSQLAINGENQLVILDPKLPNLHKSIISQVEYNHTIENFSTDKNVLNTEDMFSQSSILHTEKLIQLDVGKFNKVTFNSSSSTFEFNRITEPCFVKHQWSQLSPSDKNCYLGVLLNTGEFLVLKRTSKFSDQYIVVHNFFDVLLEVNGIEDADEITIDHSQYRSLKVKDFNFVQVSNSLHISVLTESGEIIFFKDGQVEFSIPASASAIAYEAIQYDGITYIAWKTIDNEVYVYDSTSGSRLILMASRFKIGKLLWDSSRLFVTRYRKVAVYHTSGDFFDVDIGEGNIASIVPLGDKVIIAYDHGKFDIVDLATKTVSPCTVLEKYVSNHLLKYSLNGDDNKNLSTDGNFITVGVSLNKNGILSIIHKIYPKNSINYKILSKSSFTIGFVSVSEILEIEQNNTLQTSLSSINQFWFHKFKQILVFPKNFQISSSTAFIFEHLTNLETLKQTLPKINTISLKPNKVNDFKEYLFRNFTANSQVIGYQALYNFNIVLINANNSLASKVGRLDIANSAKHPSEKLEELNKRLLEEQELIEFTIFQFLIKVIVSFDYPIKNDIDKFVFMNYYLLLNKSFELPFNDTDITVTLQNKFVTESFTVSKTATFSKLIQSNSEHYWPRCELTLLPLIDEVNLTDELERFNYLLRKPSPDGLACDLLNTLSYCIITGNKIHHS